MKDKKTLEIKGRPLYPVTVGMPAVISEEGACRKTSTVLRVKEVSTTEIQFETRNSCYRLHITKQEVSA